jgi:hypothetical protein
VLLGGLWRALVGAVVGKSVLGRIRSMKAFLRGQKIERIGAA